MERPVYHFKGIVKDGAEATKDFVGPLDLILHLLKKNKIAIRDLPLAGILEQFLAWMETRRALDLAVAGEFIAMASHLMLLKTRMLLSQEDKEAQAEMAALIASLEARQRHASAQRVRAVLPRLEALWQRGSAGFPKPPENVFFQRVYRYEHKPSDLTRALNAWQARQKLAIPPALAEFQAVVRPEPYRVEDKAAKVLALLEQRGPLRLGEILRTSRSRSEATAAFLALLELCRGGRVHLSGDREDPEIFLVPT